MPADFTPDITPVQAIGPVRLKREDLWSRAGVTGAKARAIFAMAEGTAGIISGGARHSPQLPWCAQVAQALGIGARLHTGHGKPTRETELAEAAGAQLFRHRPARQSVIAARYRADAAERPDWAHIPFGIACAAQVAQVARQAAALDSNGINRVVVPVGSGITLAGLCAGLPAHLPILGIRVGADPSRTLDQQAPGWRHRVTLTPTGTPYEQPAPAQLGTVDLDPHYEAKCLPHLCPGDLLWIVGHRPAHPLPL